MVKKKQTNPLVAVDETIQLEELLRQVGFLYEDWDLLENVTGNSRDSDNLSLVVQNIITHDLLTGNNRHRFTQILLKLFISKDVSFSAHRILTDYLLDSWEERETQMVKFFFGQHLFYYMAINPYVSYSDVNRIVDLAARIVLYVLTDGVIMSDMSSKGLAFLVAKLDEAVLTNVVWGFHHIPEYEDVKRLPIDWQLEIADLPVESRLSQTIREEFEREKLL